MSPNYPLDSQPATPEYVLDVLRESVRMQVGDELTAEWPLADLVADYNDLAWPSTRHLADGMNGTFATSIPPAEWKAAFPRLRGRTVRDLCEFLSPRIERPVFRPWGYVAGECLPAGVFLTLRALLTAKGVPASTITPSSRLPSDSSLWLGDVLWQLVRLAPGRCRMFDRVYPGWAPSVFRSLGLFGFALLPVAALLSIFAVNWAGGLLAVGVGAVAVAVIVEWLTGTTRLFPDGCRTFRDLSYALAGQPPRRRIQPTA